MQKVNRPLSELLDGISSKVVLGDTAHVFVRNVKYDSRQVEPGDLFVAIKGYQYDGHEFVPDAVKRGAAAVVTQREVACPLPQVVVPDSRFALGVLAANFYNHPSKKLRLIGVTGTNGKTTTTYLVRSLLNFAGKKVGLIGTVQYSIGDVSYPVTRTTPEAPELQNMLSKMVQAGVSHAVMEVSSHALELKRVTGCEFDVAVFTNLTQDHLDFHQNFDNYKAAKAKLFKGLGDSFKGLAKSGRKVAVINVDDAFGRELVGQTPADVITYGFGQADLRAEALELAGEKCSYSLTVNDLTTKVELGLTGKFNVYNSLAAIGVGLAEGLELSTILEGIKLLRSVPGRFERVDEGQDFVVLVDYAHTPDGLENVLLAARELAKNRLIVVFGCGGDRDRTKRPIMGEIAARLSDVVIITSDNPRSEDPEAIIDEIEAGIAKAQEPRAKVIEREADRASAIRTAISMAQEGDLVLIAGKGHETYQILKDKTVPFDDREVARNVLRSILRLE